MIRFKQFIKESMDTIFPYERVRDDVQTVEHESGPPSKIRHIHHEITLPDGSMQLHDGDTAESGSKLVRSG